MKKLWKNHRGKILLFVIIFVILFVSLPQTKAIYKSLFLLLEVAPNSQVKPLGFFSKEPILKEVVYKSGDKEIFADLYLPNDNKKHPAAVLQLGLDIDRKDSRVVMTAEALARSGIIILSPNLPTLSVRRITEDSPNELVDSFIFLKSVAQVDKKKLGFMGFCATAGVDFVSAADKRIKDDVNFIVAVDPYYDFRSLYKEITLRKLEDGKEWIPHFKSVEILNREAILLLPSANDQTILKKYLVNIPHKKLSEGEYENLTFYDRSRLTPDGLNLYLAFTSKTEKDVEKYLNLGTDIQKDVIKMLSPSEYINSISAARFVLVDTDNTLIPYTQGKKFNGKVNTYSETTIVPSGEASRSVSLRDITMLYKFLYPFLLKLNP